MFLNACLVEVTNPNESKKRQDETRTQNSLDPPVELCGCIHCSARCCKSLLFETVPAFLEGPLFHPHCHCHFLHPRDFHQCQVCRCGLNAEFLEPMDWEERCRQVRLIVTGTTMAWKHCTQMQVD